MTNNEFLKAVELLYPNREKWVSASQRKVVDETTGEDITPTEEQLQSVLQDAQNEVNLHEVRLKRLQEYPEIAEQLDMIYWDKVNGTNTWEEHITSIKDKYPKGSV